MSAETDSNKIEHKEHFHGSDLEKIDNDIMDVQDKRDDISIYSDDINKDNQQIKKIVDDSAINFATLNLEDVYELKTNIEKQMLQLYWLNVLT